MTGSFLKRNPNASKAKENAVHLHISKHWTRKQHQKAFFIFQLLFKCCFVPQKKKKKKKKKKGEVRGRGGGGITPKIRLLCFVVGLINSILLTLWCVFVIAFVSAGW